MVYDLVKCFEKQDLQFPMRSARRGSVAERARMENNLHGQGKRDELELLSFERFAVAIPTEYFAI